MIFYRNLLLPLSSHLLPVAQATVVGVVLDGFFSSYAIPLVHSATISWLEFLSNLLSSLSASSQNISSLDLNILNLEDVIPSAVSGGVLPHRHRRV